MAGKTLADHSRAYRTRKAERVRRMEAIVEQATAAILERDAGGTTLATWGALRNALGNYQALSLK